MTRREWIERADIETAHAQRGGDRFSVAIMDIDRFTAVNEAHGHVAGDRVIKRLAALGIKQMRQVAQLGRFGGQEFAVLMPGTGIEHAERQIESLRAAFADSQVDIGDGKTVTCTASIGVAAFMADDSLETLLQRARQALCTAKAGGRNRTVVADTIPQMHAAGVPSPPLRRFATSAR